MDRGVLYAAFGKPHLEEAVRSMESLRRFNDLPGALVTDQDSKEAKKLFTQVIRVERVSQPHLGKVQAIATVPFEDTLFLDTDTRVLGKLDMVFGVLERFNLGIVQDVYLSGSDELPPTFANFNSGVIVYRRGKAVEEMFERWKELTRGSLARYGRECDQPSLRVVLWEDEGVQFVSLPNNFNFRCDYPIQTSGWVTILHGRHRDLVKVEGIINTRLGLRIWLPQEMEVRRTRR